MMRAVTPRTKVITLVSPNNPTGNAVSQEQLVRLLQLGPLVVLDEAYAEFAPRTFLPLAREFDNLIVLRTFSKWAGLAGLRIGYGIFPADLMPYLWKIKPPFNVNAAALVAVEATFEDFAWVRASVARIKVERGRLYRNLRKLNILQPYPSQGNYFFCRVLARPGRRPPRAAGRSRDHGPGLRWRAVRLSADQRRPTRGYRHADEGAADDRRAVLARR